MRAACFFCCRSCHAMSWLVSCTGYPKIRGTTRSNTTSVGARISEDASLAMTLVSVSSPADVALPVLRSSATARWCSTSADTPPYCFCANGMGGGTTVTLVGIMWGYTMSNICGKDEPKKAPSIAPCRELFGRYKSSHRGQYRRTGLWNGKSDGPKGSSGCW